MQTRDDHVPIDSERLLAEDPFVRGLARQLVRDPDRADELAQQAWLQLLRSPVAATVSLRGWLATVLRRLVQRQRRGALREASMLEALRPEHVPSAATIAAREEMRARVV